MENSISDISASDREHLLFNNRVSASLRDNNLEHLQSELNNINWDDWKQAMEDVRGILQSYHSNKKDWIKFYKINQAEGNSRNEIITVPNKYTLVLTVWQPFKGNFIHDYCGSQGVVKILQGRLVEEHYSYHKEKEIGKRLKKENEITLKYNEVNDHNCFKDFHRMYNPDDKEEAVSLHVYAPPLETCRIINKDSNVTEVVQMKYASRRGEMISLEDNKLPDNKLTATYDFNPIFDDIIRKLEELNWNGKETEKLKDIRKLLQVCNTNNCDWSQYCTISDTELYSRTIIHSSSEYTLTLNYYRPGADSLPHDHGGAWCIFKVLQGKLEERHFKVNKKNGQLILDGKPKTYIRNGINNVKGYECYHSNRNPSYEEPAVTLNVFTSSDVKCRVYEPESKSSYDIGANFHAPDGLRRRRPESKSVLARRDQEDLKTLIPKSVKISNQNDKKNSIIQTVLRISAPLLSLIAVVLALTAFVIMCIGMNGKITICNNCYNFHIQNDLLGIETNTIQFSPVTVHIQIYSQNKSSVNNYEGCYQKKFEQKLDYNKKPRGIGIFESIVEIYIAGWYYIYSSMTVVPPNKMIPINGTQESAFHYVDRISPLNAGNSGILLRTVHNISQFKTMYSGGIFHLEKGDKLKVCLSKQDIRVVSESSYFGMFMLVSST